MVSDRAYLTNARTGVGLQAVEAEVSRLLSHLGETAQRIEPAALLPADILIDLYGENIRARAYTTHDPLEGELMLRPDFTVPVVQMHARNPMDQAKYVYAGPVWRRQSPESKRPNEYLQVGYESFGASNEPKAEAEVFALFAAALEDLPLSPVIGDVSLLFAAIDSLDTTERRKVALRRHVWRPKRFKRLLKRFSNDENRSELREILHSAANSKNVENLVQKSGEHVGMRSISEIISRIETLQIEAETPRLSASELERINDIQSLRTTMSDAAKLFAKIAPELTNVRENLQARADALSDQGIDPAGLAFDAVYGVTTMEYYDGFTFGFSAPDRPDLPYIAVGGRYDALTEILGSRSPAIGGIIRPEALLALKGGVS